MLFEKCYSWHLPQAQHAEVEIGKPQAHKCTDSIAIAHSATRE